MGPASFDEIGQATQAAAAAIKQLPGCQSVVLGADRTSREGHAVSTWDTEDHARWSPDVLGDVVARNRALGIQAETPQIFKVITS
jgi:hypothetical protein